MSRHTVLIAATESSRISSLHGCIKKHCQANGLRLVEGPDNSKVFDDALALFEYMENISPEQLADYLVILCLERFDEAFSCAVEEQPNGWHLARGRRPGVAIEMILRFPHVFPVFISGQVPFGDDSNKAEGSGQPGSGPKFAQKLASILPLHFVNPADFSRLIAALDQFSYGVRCWFDPTGLRTRVKDEYLKNVFEGESEEEASGDARKVLMSRLNNVAVAIDEEREFAMLNAYAAYKFGRRAWMVTTFSAFDKEPIWVSGDHSNDENVVVLRDIDLRFPDIPDDDPDHRDPAEDWTEENPVYIPLRKCLKSLRRGVWKQTRNGDSQNMDSRLGQAWKIRAVSSHPNVYSEAKTNRWPEVFFLLGESGDGENIKYCGIGKPVGSIYELSGLLSGTDSLASSSMHARIRSVDDGAQGGHGAPYFNLAIAESLVWQADTRSRGSAAYLFGALLASEAYELLLGMSKTTALEALLLMHKNEVAAEVYFPGVAHDIDINKRRKDIKATIESLYQKSVGGTHKQDDPENRDVRKKMHIQSVKNKFKAQFWAEMRVVYREGEHFNAAEQANNESLVHMLWVPVGKYCFLDQVLGSFRYLEGWLKFKRLLLEPATSLWMWVGAFIFTVTASSFGYAWAWGREWQIDWDGLWTYGRIFSQVLIGSFSFQLMNNGELEQLDHYGFWQLLVMFAHTGISYILFGLLISMIYRKITRS